MNQYSPSPATGGQHGQSQTLLRALLIPYDVEGYTGRKVYGRQEKRGRKTGYPGDGNPRVMGAGSLREAGEEKAPDGIPRRNEK